MKQVVTYLVERAKERSTWLGLLSVATALGLVFNPEQKDAVVAFGMAAGGVVATFTKDKP